MQGTQNAGSQRWASPLLLCNLKLIAPAIGKIVLCSGCNYVVINAGPPGCGKSTAMHVLAKKMGFDVCEWQPPVPTLWDEHRYHAVCFSNNAIKSYRRLRHPSACQEPSIAALSISSCEQYRLTGQFLVHQADGGLQYTSKLDDFETFVAHAKLSSLSLQPSTAASDASGAASQQSQNPPPKVRCSIARQSTIQHPARGKDPSVPFRSSHSLPAGFLRTFGDCIKDDQCSIGLDYLRIWPDGNIQDGLNGDNIYYVLTKSGWY